MPDPVNWLNQWVTWADHMMEGQPVPFPGYGKVVGENLDKLTVDVHFHHGPAQVYGVFESLAQHTLRLATEEEIARYTLTI